jgi:hypothetical protein
MYCKNCGEKLNENGGFCPNCGIYAGNGNQYCDVCGTKTSQGAAFCGNCGASLKKEQTYGEPVKGTIVSDEAARTIQPRNIVTAIIFSILTCGIYSIYWFIVLTDDLNRLTNEENDMSGGLSFILNMVTCGIYGYFWAYKMGQKVDKLNNNSSGYSGIVYILLIVFGLQIVSFALMQDTINKTVENR